MIEKQPPHEQRGRAALCESYVPSAPAAPRPQDALARPLDAAEAAEKEQNAPAFMQQSIKAAAEAYEADPVRLRTVRLAAGYDPSLWRQRYREEALCTEGVFHGLSLGSIVTKSRVWWCPARRVTSTK